MAGDGNIKISKFEGHDLALEDTYQRLSLPKEVTQTLSRKETKSDEARWMESIGSKCCLAW